MDKYLAKIERGKYSYYYKDNNLLFIMKINYTILGFVTKCTFYDNEKNEILSFKKNNFLIGMTLKLLHQSLPQPIFIERKNIDTYYLTVKGKKIYFKITYLSYLMKNFGEIFINGKEYGKVVRNKKTMMYANFEFNFSEEDSEINYYCMFLFAMHTIGYSNVRYN